MERKKTGDSKSKADRAVKRRKAVSAEIVGSIRKELGDEGAAMLLGDTSLSIAIKGVCSTQSLTLDAAIGRGGVPYGRLTILAGPEGGGKTTVALHLAAECQTRGGIVLYMDMEYKLDPDYAKGIGVNIDDLILSQPPHLEGCLTVMKATIKRIAKFRADEKLEIPMLIVLDSMTAAPAKVEIEGNIGDKFYAPQAGVMSSGLKHLIPQVSKERVGLVFISQLREKIGVMFGNKTDTTCGKAPRFYASLGMDIKKKGKMEGNDNAHLCEGYVWKNQIAAPFKRGEFVIEYGRGIDAEDAIMRAAIAQGIVEQKGAWYSHGGERLGQGLENSKETLRKNPEWATRIAGEVML